MYSNQTYYFNGQGVLKIALYDKLTKALQAFYDAGDIKSLKLATSVQNYSLTENRTGKRLKAIDIKHSPELTWEAVVRDFSMRTLAIAAFGERTVQEAEAITDLVIGDVVPGAYYQFGPMGSTITSAVNGSAEAVAANKITVHADGTFSVSEAVTGFKVVAGTKGAIDYVQLMQTNGLEVALIFDGINTFGSNRPYVLQIWRSSIAPMEGMDLVSSEVAAGELTLKGTALEAPAGAQVAIDGPVAGYGILAYKAA